MQLKIRIYIITNSKTVREIGRETEIAKDKRKMGKIQCTDGFKVLSLVPCQGAIFIPEGFLDEVSFKMKDLEKMVRLTVRAESDSGAAGENACMLKGNEGCLEGLCA